MIETIEVTKFREYVNAFNDKHLILKNFDIAVTNDEFFNLVCVRFESNTKKYYEITISVQNAEQSYLDIMEHYESFIMVY